MEHCDFCDGTFDMQDRRVVAQRRPSDPTEIVAVMWACPGCGDEHNLPTADALVNAVEERRESLGSIDLKGIIFVTV